MELKVENLACGYGDKVLVKDINLSVRDGEIVCVLGPNGVGKTTFFRTILGFLPKKAGEVWLDGQEITKLRPRQLAQVIAYVPQTRTPPFAFKVREVVAMGRTPEMRPFSVPSAQDYAICDELLEKLGVSHLRDRVFNELSGGECQMVLIARALAQQPKLLMMDEPTSNLDFGNQIRMLQCICRLAKEGIGIIMTTHFPDHAFLCSTKVALFSREKGFIYGTADEVITAETMSDTYHIQVGVTESRSPSGKIVKSCTPYME